LELAQTFLEEALDLPPTEKESLTVPVIARQLAFKFPEITREGQNL
jgi:hypothetical protein